jgi:hypothetical protein
MCQEQHSTVVMENTVRGGTTFMCYSEKFRIGATVVLDYRSSRLLLLTENGDYVWTSELLDVSLQLPVKDMEALIQQALKHWLLLVTLRSTKQQTGYSSIELISMLYNQMEPILA